jgi:phosphoribosylaminoimidazole (AIR) synthetase
MAKTFNCGIGMVAVVSEGKIGYVTKVLGDAGETVHHIGEITPRNHEDEIVAVHNIELAWK